MKRDNFIYLNMSSEPIENIDEVAVVEEEEKKEKKNKAFQIIYYLLRRHFFLFNCFLTKVDKLISSHAKKILSKLIICHEQIITDENLFFLLLINLNECTYILILFSIQNQKIYLDLIND